MPTQDTFDDNFDELSFSNDDSLNEMERKAAKYKRTQRRGKFRTYRNQFELDSCYHAGPGEEDEDFLDDYDDDDVDWGNSYNPSHQD